MVLDVHQFALGCLLTVLQYKSGTFNFNLSMVSAVSCTVLLPTICFHRKLGSVPMCQLILPLFVLYYFLPVIWHSFVSIYLL